MNDGADPLRSAADGVRANEAPSFRTVGWRLDGRVVVLTLDRPASLNALNRDLKEDLLAALGEAAVTADARAVVLTGAGRAFCVGQDLGEVEAALEADGQLDFAAEVRERYNPIVLAIRELEKPVVAAVNGIAAGAGMSLAVACDIRVLAEDAAFVPGFGAIGLVPDSGLSWLLPRIVGAGRAAEILLGGEKLGAVDAERIGLANRVVPGTTLLPEAIALAARLSGGSGLAMGLTKRALNLGQEVTLEESLDLEAQFQGIAGRSPEHAEGLAAFRERRRPTSGDSSGG